jgi:DNA polymerase eta
VRRVPRRIAFSNEQHSYDNAKPETHKVSLEHYRRESVKILKIFEQYCPTIGKAFPPVAR